MLTNISSTDKFTLMQIMIFYSVLSYFIFPLIGLYIKKNKEGITHGMILGSIVCIFLWIKYGSSMIKLA
jgi:Na+/proline symporter